MLLFGHLGFGYQLVAPWRRRFPGWPLALGMLLPDIIDKPLYYSGISDFISCTRTFGHTGLLCLAMFGLGRLLRKQAFTAVGLGMATHFVLDFVMDVWTGDASKADGPSSIGVAVLWPLRGPFVVDRPTLAEHLHALLNGPVIVTEILGIILLAWVLSRR
jgi:hypothetical protein